MIHTRENLANAQAGGFFLRELATFRDNPEPVLRHINEVAQRIHVTNMGHTALATENQSYSNSSRSIDDIVPDLVRYVEEPLDDFRR